MPNRQDVDMEENDIPTRSFEGGSGHCVRKRVPIAEQNWPDGTAPVVSICCVTYNHERFIHDCLDGFLMQETTFPVEILVHDDASTDNTADVVRQYEMRHPSLIKAIYQKENQWARGVRPNPEFNFPRARGKYIAFCEGDDYWSKKDKLQRQFLALEQDGQARVCFHKVVVVGESEEKPIRRSVPRGLDKTTYSCEEITKRNIIPTCSVLGLREAVTETPEWFFKLPMNDWPRWVMACRDGYAIFIDREMSVYREHNGGIWSGLNKADQLLGSYDFYSMIECHGPGCARKVASEAKRQLIIKLTRNHDAIAKLNRIMDHVFFGRLISFWKRFVNKKFLA